MVVGGTFVANLLWWYFARKAVMVVGGTFVLFPFCGNKGKTESSILMYQELMRSTHTIDAGDATSI